MRIHETCQCTHGLRYEGPDIGELQRLLAARSGRKLVISGRVDPATVDALRAFQQRAGLRVTGRFDRPTQNALRQPAQSGGLSRVVETRSWGASLRAPSSPARAPMQLEGAVADALQEGSHGIRRAIDARLVRFGVPEGGFSGQGSVYTRRGPRVFFTLRAIQRNARAVTQNLRRASNLFSDPAMLIAVVGREHASGLWARGSATIDTWNSGGLDHLGAQMARIPALRRRPGWRDPGARNAREGGITRRVHPARIPERDQLLAYAGVLRLAEQRFESHVQDVFGEDAEVLLRGLTQDARRVWIQYSFARPGIETDGTRPSDRNFSAHNALELLRERGESLNAILKSPELAENRSVRIARQRALEASLFDEVLE